MNYMLLTLVTLGVSIQQICKKAYNKKTGGGAFTFSAATSLIALLFFIGTSKGEFNFQPELLWYSISFAICFCLASVCSFLAISTGSLSLTSLFTQYSLLIPTIYGLLFLNESASTFLLVGILLLLASVIFVNFESKGEKKQITLKWFVFVFLAFVGNGCCSAIQKVQQLNFNGLYKNELMIVALGIVTLTLFIISLFAERDSIKFNIKKGCMLFLISGLANGLVNYLVLVLSSKMPASVMFPVISAGGIVATALVSIFVYKEKLSKYQIIGLILGTISIIALNL